jgi:(S)-mandelate dehydrogenase
MEGTPARRFYGGANMARAVAIADLRARTHKLMPRFVLEYLEGGAEDEATLYREREAFAEWRFMPHTLADEAHIDLTSDILGKSALMPLVVAPTGLNGLFRHDADIQLAQGAAAMRTPFVQSTMSTDPMEDVARTPGLRHWWQLYVFGGDEVWQELLRRADACGVEALVLTTNSQIFGNREWDARTRATRTRPSASTVFDAALHPRWLADTLARRGMPRFANIIDFVPKDRRGFFESAFWVRDQMPRNLSWETVKKIRARWTKPMFIKGVLNLEDVRRSLDAGVDGLMLGSHGGRQMDWAVSALDILEDAREIVGDRIELYVSGGVRRGTDVLKAKALGANAVMTGRATLYGLCAGGTEGVRRAIGILHDETANALGQLGVPSLADLTANVLSRQAGLPMPRHHPAA